MDQKQFKMQLEEKIAYIEQVIKSYLPEEKGYQKSVIEAMNYSVVGGGKRIRPLLMLETYSLLGGIDQKQIEPFLAAIEFIHTYSLIHDDLPAMDNDEYRRGRKTTHIVYGEALGILAGDALLNYAFETAIQAFQLEIDKERVLYALEVLTKKPGIYGMIGGQVVDVQSEQQQIEKDKVDFIYKLKTAALIEASMMIGAILAGAEKEQVEQIEQLARKVGLAFQIQDDILDVTSSTKVLGKTVHSDERNKKVTYVTLVGIEHAKGYVDAYSREAIKTLEYFSNSKDSLNLKDSLNSGEFLKQFIITLIERKK